MSTTLDATERPRELTARAGSGETSALRLVAAVQALSLARSLESIIEIVRTAARDVARADGASFILRDGEKCYYVDEDAVGPLWKGQRFPMTLCISGWVMLNRRATVIKNIYDDPRVPIDAYSPTFVRSLAMVPIRTEDPIGAIGIYWSQEHAASDFEIELIQALANTTSVAMENVRLYEELEHRVQDRTRKLEDANRELETFSYSVSHDLQAPLRHINSYADLLTRGYEGALDEAGKGYLGRIRASSTRMATLIADLLRLARFTKIELRLERVDLSGLAQELAAALRESDPGRSVDLQIEEGVEATGDRALLRVVLDNLLGNAWKFTAKRDSARIQFGCQSKDGQAPVYFVRDNGAGFDMRYADALFTPFRRPHSDQEFNGTGVGLATVGRIVRRHGGSIWAEALPHEGATFFFTLEAEKTVSPLATLSKTKLAR